MAVRSRNWYALLTPEQLSEQEFLENVSDHYVASQLQTSCTEGNMVAFRGQLERGEQGELHHQMWWRMKSQRTLSSMIRLGTSLFPGRHVGFVKCDRKIPHQLTYVSKETDLTKTPKVYGREPTHDVYQGGEIERLLEQGHGATSDVRRMKDMVLADCNVPLSTLIEECGHAGTYVNVIQLLRSEKQPKRDSTVRHTAIA